MDEGTLDTLGPDQVFPINNYLSNPRNLNNMAELIFS